MNDKHAFPNLGEYGLTKREWFAGQALAGMVANTLISRGFAETQTCEEVVFSILARDSFAIADAMIAESERTGK